MRFLKKVIYHLFLAFRGIFFLVFTFVSNLSLLASVVVFLLYFCQDKQAKTLVLGFACLGFFLLMYLLKHFYDKIIFWAKPDDVELMLFK